MYVRRAIVKGIKKEVGERVALNSLNEWGSTHGAVVHGRLWRRQQ